MGAEASFIYFVFLTEQLLLSWGQGLDSGRHRAQLFGWLPSFSMRIEAIAVADVAVVLSGEWEWILWAIPRLLHQNLPGRSCHILGSLHHTSVMVCFFKMFAASQCEGTH